MRLFIGIEVSSDMRRELASVSKALRERSCGGRFVPPENFHITLRFIGESEDLLGAAEAMREAVRGIRPFTLRLGGYGFFEKTDSGNHRVSLVDVKGELEELGILHETLESALADRGFPRDMKRYRPHITLGRSVEHDELTASELRAMELSASMQVKAITLFESVKVKGKQVYNPLHRESF